MTLLVPFAALDGEETRFVTRAKYPISFFSCGHGSVPPFPIPSEGVAARMSVRLGGFGMLDASLDVSVVRAVFDEGAVASGWDIA